MKFWNVIMSLCKFTFNLKLLAYYYLVLSNRLNDRFLNKNYIYIYIFFFFDWTKVTVNLIYGNVNKIDFRITKNYTYIRIYFNRKRRTGSGHAIILYLRFLFIRSICDQFLVHLCVKDAMRPTTNFAEHVWKCYNYASVSIKVDIPIPSKD